MSLNFKQYLIELLTRLNGNAFAYFHVKMGRHSFYVNNFIQRRSKRHFWWALVMKKNEKKVTASPPMNGWIILPDEESPCRQGVHFQTVEKKIAYSDFMRATLFIFPFVSIPSFMSAHEWRWVTLEMLLGRLVWIHAVPWQTGKPRRDAECLETVYTCKHVGRL